ncbi:hypothetical protein JK358_01585 [Nocardia sp. 2]|uniref:DUF6879 domain-containing protein n=1 Tax=Nocardia acididurans TaxID=2802282 RepID=A0ABS1LXJ8_9NOCA|nr:DUF6879 family protein [Nocardia acididurans]MBL1073078.1 hypothetical protein [Nocardia acididurans]
MQLLDIEGVNNLVGNSEKEAFHLELLDDYESPGGDAPYRNWLAGGPEDDYAWFQDWLSLVRGMTSRGAVMRRVRVATVPLSDYQRWMLEVTFNNIDAGEDIRYLPRHLADAHRLGTDDWWLVDDAIVSFTLFDPAGNWVGGAVTTDPRIVDLCRQTRDYVWPMAIRYGEFQKSVSE